MVCQVKTLPCLDLAYLAARNPPGTMVCEFYFVNTRREGLDIRVRKWLGVRTGNAVAAQSCLPFPQVTITFRGSIVTIQHL